MTSLPPITLSSAAFPAVSISLTVSIAFGESRISVLTYSTRFLKKPYWSWWTEHVSKCVASSQWFNTVSISFLADFHGPASSQPTTIQPAVLWSKRKEVPNHDKALSWNSLMVIYTMTFLHCQYLLWYFFMQSKRKTHPHLFLYPPASYQQVRVPQYLFSFSWFLCCFCKL